MKGDKARRKTYFKKHHPQLYHRQKSVIVQQSPAGSNAPDSDCPEGTPPVTRSQSEKNKRLGKHSDYEYFIVEKNKLETLANTSFRMHLQKSPSCKGFLHLNKVKQWSISSIWQFVCDTCPYIGEPHKMYVEVETNTKGRKASSLNRAMGIALTKSPIGVAVCTEMFLTLGIDPGSQRGMQDNLNKSSDLIHSLASENMRDEREKLKKYPELAVEVDTRYNNPLRSPNTPFQGGTQAIFTVAENMTPEKKIISATFASKVCRTGSRQLAYGLQVTCPNHQGCTATMPPQEAIGKEETYAKESALVLKNDNLNLGTVTHDQDSGQLKGIQSVFPNVVSLKDSRHFSQSQRKQINKTQFSNNMFVGKTKRVRKKNSYGSQRTYENAVMQSLKQPTVLSKK